MRHPGFTSYSYLASLRDTAQQLLAYANTQKVWLFTGNLGAGKTTLIKAICAELGIQEPVTSPTFGLVHEYALPTKEPVYHLDAYRIINGQEAAAQEFQPYLDGDYYCFVEWPMNLTQVVFPRHMAIDIVIQAHGARRVHAQLIA